MNQRWAQLTAEHVLSSLDDADEAAYTRHAAQCSSCQHLQRELGATLADLAHILAQVAPPPSLKPAVMRAVVEDDAKHTASVAPIGGERSVSDLTDSWLRSRARHHRLAWIAAAAAAVAVIVGGSIAWNLTDHKQTSVAARCAKAHCLTVALRADGAQVATVMVLDQTAYLQTQGLLATPADHSYVLWRISAGKSPVGVAAVRTQPESEPVKAGTLTVPVSDVTTFALSEENGNSVPATPTDVIAQGNTS